MTKSNQIKNVALCITHNCNLRCKYCYSGKKSGKKMSLETAKKAIDFIDQNSSKRCLLTFFGGEPLLEMNLIKSVVEYAEEKCKDKISFRLSTNGTLINDEMLKFFGEHKIYFAISIDGDEKQHNLNRKYANENGSYDRLKEKFESILSFNPYTIAMSVITPETVDYVATGVKSIFENGFKYITQSLNFSAKWEIKDLKKLRNQYRQLSDYYFEKIRNGEKIYYSSFDERIKTWAQKKYMAGDFCDLAKTEIAIAPSGRIYPCVQFIADDGVLEQINCIGDVENGFNEEKRNFFIKENYAEKSDCKDCPLEGRCATYCGCANWKATGSVGKVPPLICEYERMLMPVADKLGNRLWKANSKLFKAKYYQPFFLVSSYLEDCLVKRSD